jgi:PEP-CTERM motif
VRSSSKVILLFLALVLCVAGASASSVDPGIIIRDPVGCPSGNCVSITGTSFTFSVPSGGFGLLHFLNASGITWNTLTLTELGVPAINVSCSSDVFSCSVVAFGQNGAKILLTAAAGLPGIPNGNSFEIILGCKNGDCPHWPAGLEFSAVANASVPEPATMALLLTGLGAICTRKKLRAKGVV